MGLDNHGFNDMRKYQWYYWTVAERRYSSELGHYETYGILSAKVAPDGWILIKVLHDVALDREAVRKMSELFTEHQLSPVHLLDAVEDMLL